MNAHAIQLPTAYYERLGSSLEEKLFFVERIPDDVTVFADFGCGDGRLLTSLLTLRSHTVKHVIGYDRQAEALPQDIIWGGTFTDSLPRFKADILRNHRLGRKVCLILSSVVHELLSQRIGWNSIWNMVRDLDPDYIVIRDMACSAEAVLSPPKHSVARKLEADPRMTGSLIYNAVEVGQFSTQAEMLQALLKYRYTENLKHELEEDYFSLTAEQWLNLTTIGSGYKLQHFDHHSVAWHRENWKQDFGIDIPDPTHVKIILKKA